MADYSQLTSYVAKLKRAAIDAYMYTAYKASVDGSTYTLSDLSTEDTFDYNKRVTCPNEAGEGGGEYTDALMNAGRNATATAAFQAEFEAVRSRIDLAMAPWWGLPDPSCVDGEYGKERQVASRLAMQEEKMGDSRNPTGPLAAIFPAIKGLANQLEGDTADAFDTFLGRLADSSNSLHGIAYVLAEALMAEETLWAKTRQAVADITSECIDKMNEIVVHAHGSDWKLVVDIVEDVVDVIAVWFPEAKALSLLTDAGKAVKEALPDDTKAATFDVVMQSFETKLIRAQQDTRALESGLNDQLNRVAREVQDDVKGFDSSYAPSEPSITKGIKINPDLAHQIYKDRLPAAQRELDAVGVLAYSVNFVVYRDDRLGIGYNGPDAAWNNLSSILVNLCKNLASQCSLGADELKAAVDDMQRHDRASAAALNKADAALKKGSGIQIFH